MNAYQFSKNKEINDMLNQVVHRIDSFAHRQLQHIERLTRIGSSLSSETDLEKILHLILEEAIAYTNADGATIYMVSDDKTVLDFKIVYNRTLNIKYGGIWGKVSWNSVPLYDASGNASLKNMVSYVYHNQKPLVIDDVYDQDIYDISGTVKADKANNYRSKSMIAIPLKNHEDDVLGIIQLINSIESSGEIQNFNEEHSVMLSSLASQAAIALTNKLLIEGLEELLRQFVKSIAYALDKKSKYSGMHISRVAILTEMFVNTINNYNEGVFLNINFNENETEEISLAGWLHDIGKIITPEYVMDKSTKLEGIYDKIELVEMRFKVIETLIDNQILKLSPENNANKISELEKILEQLQSYLALIQKTNIGGEFLNDQAIATLKEILEFRFECDGTEYFLIDEEDFEKLSVRRGTLTQNERSIIEEHAITTQEILDQLSYPKKFRNIPLYAASHHEKLDGTGYPSQLTAEELPLPARIIATADIFEALTAADRPYKEGKKLSEALKIMSFMVKDNHLDRDLYNLLLDSGLYLEYAKKFIDVDQIDEIDIEKFKINK